VELLARVGKLVGCDGAGWLRDRAALAGLPAGDEGTVASIELLWQEIAAGGEARSGEPGDIGQS
jgi:hypothetical protein